MKIDINKINLNEEKIIRRFGVFSLGYKKEEGPKEEIVMEENVVMTTDTTPIWSTGNIGKGRGSEFVVPSIDTSGC